MEEVKDVMKNERKKMRQVTSHSLCKFYCKPGMIDVTKETKFTCFYHDDEKVITYVKECFTDRLQQSNKRRSDKIS